MQRATASRAQTNDATQNAGSPPVDKFRDGPVHVSIWENQGPRGAFRTASFEVRYQDSDNKWQSGHSYTAAALLHLEKAASEARTRIEKWRQAQPQPEPRR